MMVSAQNLSPTAEPKQTTDPQGRGGPEVGVVVRRAGSCTCAGPPKLTDLADAATSAASARLATHLDAAEASTDDRVLADLCCRDLHIARAAPSVTAAAGLAEG